VLKSENLSPKVQIVLQILGLIFFLYLFLFSIDLMGSSFKLFGKSFAETLISNTSNPLIGLFIGILATSLIQSSSSTTSIVVGMVGGGAMTVANAIPIVMGANVGTSVTNTLVAMAHINRSNEFKRSFAASTVHDFFNLLAVAILFPIQYFTNFLGTLARFLGENFQNVGGLTLFNPIKSSTKPVVKLLIDWIGDYPWSLLIIALIVLFIALKQIVNVLRVLVGKRTEGWFDKVLFKNGARAFVVGLIITLLAQSSSITTSLIVPMAGAGILNVGTTVTAMLASLVTGNLNAVVVAFAHLMFNISGIAVLWPLAKLPIAMAEKLAEFSLRNKVYPIAYIIIVFFLIPLLVFILFN